MLLHSLTVLRHLSKPVCALLILAIGIRLICWSTGLTDTNRLLKPDSSDYLRLAGSLFEDREFGTDTQPEIFRAPGYPLILACFKPLTDSPALPSLFQVLLDICLCVLVWDQARRMFYSYSGVIASLAFQSFSVVSVVYATQILSDSIFTTLLFVLLIMLPKLANGRRFELRISIICGAIIAFMTYLRAITLLYLFIPILLLIFYKKYKESLVLTLVAVVLISPWFLRNHFLVGYPHFSSVGAINSYRYNACLLLANQREISYQQQQSAIDDELSQHNSQQDKAVYAMRRGKEIILSQPLTYTALHLRANLASLLPAGGELLRLFGYQGGGRGTLGVLHSHGLLAAINHYFQGNWWVIFFGAPVVMVLFLVYTCASIGVTHRLILRQISFTDILFLSTLIYFLLVPGGASHPRFRVPVTPILSIYAGAGFILMQGGLKRYFAKSKIFR